MHFGLTEVLLGLVARSDSRPPGVQMVASSILQSGKIFFCGVLVIKSFLWPFSPYADSIRAFVSYWRKDEYWLAAQE